jgi:glycosyltransferase involved in cell wall biosynthesis
LIYESLDIHRLLLSHGIAGRFVQKMERFYVERADLILTSSPGFVREYFRPRFGPDVPIRIVENKLLQVDAPFSLNRAKRVRNREQTPWTIGWFGALRCAESLRVLTALATALAGKVKVIIRGFPAPSILGDLEKQLEKVPHVRFEGRYRSPEDLEQIYAEVDFVWAIDMWETDTNSKWLLPNRLYEGGYFGAVPLAQADTEVGRWVKVHGAGVQFPSPLLSNMTSFFESLDQGRFDTLVSAVASLPPETWVDRSVDCQALLSTMVTRRSSIPV